MLTAQRTDVEIDGVGLLDLLRHAGDTDAPVARRGVRRRGHRPLVLIGLAVAAVVEGEAAVDIGRAGLFIGNGHAHAEAIVLLGVAVGKLRHHGRACIQQGRVGVGGGGDGYMTFVQCVARKVGDRIVQRAVGTGCVLAEFELCDHDFAVVSLHRPALADGDGLHDEAGVAGIAVIIGQEELGAHGDIVAVRVLQVGGGQRVPPVDEPALLDVGHGDALHALVHVERQGETVACAQVQVARVGVTLFVIVRGAGPLVGLAQGLLHIGVVQRQVKGHLLHIGDGGVQRQVGGGEILAHDGVARKVGDVAGGGGQAKGAAVDLYIFGDGEAAVGAYLLERQVFAEESGGVEGVDLQILALGHGILEDQVAAVELDQLGVILAGALAVGLQVEIELALAGGAVVGKADGLVKAELDAHALPRAHADALCALDPAAAIHAVGRAGADRGTLVAERHHEILGIGAAAGAGAGFKVGPFKNAVAESQAAIVVAILIVNGVEAVGSVALDPTEVADTGISPRLVAPAVDDPRAAAESGGDLFRHRHLGCIGLDLFPAVVTVAVGAVIEGGGGVELKVFGHLHQFLEHRGRSQAEVPGLLVSRGAVAVLCLLAVALALV